MWDPGMQGLAWAKSTSTLLEAEGLGFEFGVAVRGLADMHIPRFWRLGAEGLGFEVGVPVSGFGVSRVSC